MRVALITLVAASSASPHNTLVDDGTVSKRALIMPTDEPASCATRPNLAPRTAVFYINVESASERRDTMETTLRRTCLPWARWNASEYLPAEADVEKTRARFPRFGMSAQSVEVDRKRFRSLTGVHSSHTHLIKHLQRNGGPGETYLVLEDDVDFGEADLSEMLAQVIALNAPRDWDMLRFSCWGKERTDPSIFNEVSEGVFSVNSTNLCGRKAGDRPPKTADEQPRSVVKKAEKTNENHNDDNKAPPRSCFYCGGAHATLYRHEALERVADMLDRWQALSPDCAFARADENNLKAYCVQTTPIRLSEQAGRSTAGGRRLDPPQHPLRGLAGLWGLW